MKVKEIRELSTEDINAKLKETKEELFNLRFQQVILKSLQEFVI